MSPVKNYLWISIDRERKDNLEKSKNGFKFRTVAEWRSKWREFGVVLLILHVGHVNAVESKCKNSI